MYIYIIMLIISIIFCFFSIHQKQKIPKCIFATLSAMPFLIISAIRYDVGTDYFYRYVSSFEYIKRGFEISNLEVGYKFLNKFVLSFSNDYIWIFILTSMFIIGIIFNTIYKRSKNPILSITLFFWGGYFFQSLNMIRQYMSIVVVMGAYHLVIEKKYLKYVFFVFVSSLFHSSSWIYLLLIFFNKKSFFSPKIILFFSGVIVLFKQLLLDFIVKLLSFSKFAVYFSTSFNVSQLRITLLLSNIVIYCIMYYLYNKKCKNNISTKEDVLFINIQSIGLLFCVSGLITYLTFRVAILFFAFQIISIPYLLDNQNVNIKKNITLILILFLIICIHHTNIKNNDEGVLPYQTIFNLERRHYYETFNIYHSTSL